MYGSSLGTRGDPSLSTFSCFGELLEVHPPGILWVYGSWSTRGDPSLSIVELIDKVDMWEEKRNALEIKKLRRF